MPCCGATCPDLTVPCGSRPHGPEVAHHASGTAGDGTRWSVFWWQPGDEPEPAVPVAAPAGSLEWAPGRPPR